MMSTFARTSPFLRWVLLADAATCAAMGLLLLLGAGWLAQFLELPPDLSRLAGASLLPFAALLVYSAGRATLVPAAIWAVILLNVLWVMGSILLLVEGLIEPNSLGVAFVIFQAGGVALFAALEYFGLRQSLTMVD